MTLHEAIDIIEQQKKYITGNPKLVEANDCLLNFVKTVQEDDKRFKILCFFLNEIATTGKIRIFNFNEVYKIAEQYVEGMESE